MADTFSYKRIADPVHGSIGISKVEARILNTKNFLRLRNISQLGLADYVYPSGNYSRFSHSLGVCNVTGKMLDVLRRSSETSVDFTDSEIQKYRLAGLLHDIGHYPFSHAMEVVLRNLSASSLFHDDATRTYLSHEELGAKIIEEDREIAGILDSENIKPYEIHSIFNRSEPPKLANLISSDLDADRIDYMLRTAKNTGLPYGNVDVDYIISQISLDRKKNVCLPEKALRTAEHFLLCRFFDYQQVYFHKAVVGIELVLKDVLNEMLIQGDIRCTASDIGGMMRSAKWSSFDEIFLYSKMRSLLKNKKTQKLLKQKIDAVLHRKIPRLVYSANCFNTDGADQNKYRDKLIVKHIDELAVELGVDRSLWYFWNMPMAFTKIPGQAPITESPDVDKVMQSIYIKDSNEESRPIMALSHSLMFILSKYSFNSSRLYVLLDRKDQQKYQVICQKIKKVIEE